jgi:hypothetical protein
MKKVLLVAAILSLFASFVYADSIKPVTLVDGDKGRSCLDANTGAVNTITYEHHEIHGGSTFHADYYNTCTNIGEGSAIVFKTPNTTKWIHGVVAFSSTAGATAYLYEASDLTLSTSLTVAALNRDRNSATTSTITTIGSPATTGSYNTMDETTYATVKVPSTATTLYTRPLGAATAGQDTAGESREVSEWILKQNTQYAIVVVSTTADDNIHHIALDYYEHTNR